MTHDEQIAEIMENLDFDKVHSAMKALDWKWASLDPVAVPTHYQLIEAARAHLTEAANDKAKYSLSASGGFVAENIDGQLRLSFYVSTWECEQK